MAERRDEMRASDGDRETVAERLRLALSEGRLTLAEFDERLQQAYQSKTYGDLDQLLADLPPPRPAERSQLAPVTGAALRPAAATDPSAVPRWLASMWGTWGLAVGINVVIWLGIAVATLDAPYFWPMWVAGPWGVVLLFMTINGLASGEPQRWAEKRARKRNRR